MRALKALVALGGFAAACGGRSMEIIPGYNGASEVHGASGNSSGAGVTAQGGTGGAAGFASSGGRSGLGGTGGTGGMGIGGGSSLGGGTSGRGGASGGAGASVNGGSDGGGSAGSGSGPVCEGALTSDRFDPNRVYLAGTLSEGACDYPALVTPECPNSAAVGFDCEFDGNSDPRQDTAQIRPSDGRLLYTLTFDPELREFRCDSCPYTASNANGYPKDNFANDPLVESPCTPGFGAPDFLVSPEGALYFRCDDGNWLDQVGKVVYASTEFTLAYVGYGGHALTRASDSIYSYAGASVVDLASGKTSHVTGLPDVSVYSLRAAPPDRFLVFLVIEHDSPDPDQSELWEIDASGKATRRGEYPPFPIEVGPSPGAKLLIDGVLYQMARGPLIDDVILRREIGGTSEIVYTEANDPNVKIHISGLVTGS